MQHLFWSVFDLFLFHSCLHIAIYRWGNFSSYHESDIYIPIFSFFVTRHLWSNVSNAFCRSMKQAWPRDFSIDFRSYEIGNRQNCIYARPFGPESTVIYRDNTIFLSKIDHAWLEHFLKHFTYRAYQTYWSIIFGFSLNSFFLKIGMTFAILRHFGHVRSSMHLLKAAAIAGSKTGEQNLRISLIIPTKP